MKILGTGLQNSLGLPVTSLLAQLDSIGRNPTCRMSL